MKYFVKENLIKEAAWTEMIEREMNLDSPSLYNSEAARKLIASIRDIEARRPLAPGKNPDPTAHHIMPDVGYPSIG